MNEEFSIDDKGSADWALERISEARKKIDENKAYADMQRDKIDKWLEDVNSEPEGTINFMEGHLQLYLMTEEISSMKLINGNIRLNKRWDKWNYDKDVLIKELEDTELHGLIRVKREPALKDMKNALTVVNGKVMYEKTGEIIESISLEEQSPSFTVTLK